MNVGLGKTNYWLSFFLLFNLGGKQPLMKDGFFKDSLGNTVVQSMVFKEGPNKGKAKGLKQVCTERFGPNVVVGKRQDDLGKLI